MEINREYVNNSQIVPIKSAVLLELSINGIANSQ